MCGIAGYINFNNKPVSKFILKEMGEAIKHRGPDGEGYWFNNNVGIVHRRLSIIDLSDAGSQPMISKNKRYILSYNGEIYNYRELRKILIKKGYFFSSQSDSEVVLNSLIEWGKNAIEKFNGMFAFVLWDNEKKEFLIARDRYGIKPLYYSIQKSTFSFASEQKSILKLNNFNRKIEHQAFVEYLTFQNIFSNITFFKDIYLLQPGYFGVFSEKNKSLNIYKYWDYLFKSENKINQNEYKDQLNFYFKQAVERQLVSDVEVGSYLSGGIDSGSITSIASKIYPNLKTFTCGFDLTSVSNLELGFDERKKAKQISTFLKTEHNEMILSYGDMEKCLKRLAWHIEEPRVGQSYPNYYIAQLASKFVKVILSGSGGDELFAGYPWRYYKSSNTQNFEKFIDSYYLYWQRLIDNKDIKQLLNPIKSEVKDVWTRDIFRNVFLQHEITLDSPTDYINHSLYFEAKTFLHGLLVIEDKISMSFGLENRVPFLDNDLVDFAMSCPLSLKLNNLENNFRIDENFVGNKSKKYFEKTNDGKQILRKALSEYLPALITNAEKKGFSSPDATWFKNQSMQWVKEKLLNKNSRIYDYLDFSKSKSLLEDHFVGKENRRLFIWSLLNLDEYLIQNF